jgi:hypothetical protein
VDKSETFLFVTAFGIMTNSITTNISDIQHNTFTIMTFCIVTFSITIKNFNTQHHDKNNKLQDLA